MSQKVAILLCTYDGQQYLPEQLESFEAQTHSDWVVCASDDGSKDDTLAILARYESKWRPGQMRVFNGPRKGFVANFLSLTCNPDIQADLYAYSDQDDVWHAEKLERAVQWHASVPAGMPALYCTRTALVDGAGAPIGQSPLFTRPPSFANALTQNVGGGNTMVFNDAARQLLLNAGPQPKAVAHDWWVYLLISACGGKVHYDPRPSLLYRQHGGNLIGANASIGARIERIRMLLAGHLRDWNDRNIQMLTPLQAQLTEQNRETFNRFAAARKKGPVGRLVGVLKSGVYRQTALGNLGLLVAAVFNKI